MATKATTIKTTLIEVEAGVDIKTTLTGVEAGVDIKATTTKITLIEAEAGVGIKATTIMMILKREYLLGVILITMTGLIKEIAETIEVVSKIKASTTIHSIRVIHGQIIVTQILDPKDKIIIFKELV